MTTEVPPLPAALADLAGARRRIVDEHMYRLPPEARWRATFRLQLFSAPGLRSVAIATQMPAAGDGASLTNAAEACAQTVWRQHFADDPEPPIWVSHMIIDESRHLTLVKFDADRAERTLNRPRFLRVEPADVGALVGQPVDLERGSGFTPPETEPDPEFAYTARLVVLLPRPRPFRERRCMEAGVPWWRRLGRQLVPRRGGRDCCWYHGGDWQTVTHLAIRLTKQARDEGVTFDETAAYVLDHPDAQHLSSWEEQALHSLLADTIRPYAPWPRREGYNNGQHRAQAMLDAGVRRVLIEHEPK